MTPLALARQDLRDVSAPPLTADQRLALVERIVRSYPFLQPPRPLFGGMR